MGRENVDLEDGGWIGGKRECRFRRMDRGERECRFRRMEREKRECRFRGEDGAGEERMQI